MKLRRTENMAGRENVFVCVSTSHVLMLYGVGDREKLKNTWQEESLRRQITKQIMKCGVFYQVIGKFCEGCRNPSDHQIGSMINLES